MNGVKRIFNDEDKNMRDIVKIKYDKNTNELKITYADKEMDTSKIEDFSIEQWLFPFYANGVIWRGLYEEILSFVGTKDYVLRFDGDDESFSLLKHAFAKTNVKLVGTNNIVTIIYHENPFSTKITINGKLLDTSLIQNRCIDEWVKPITIRDFRWNGIYTELENEIGTDVYTVYFVGELEFMNTLIQECPKSVSVFYRNPNILKQGIRGGALPKIDMTNITETAQKKIDDIQQNLGSKNNVLEKANDYTTNSFLKKNLTAILAVATILLLFLPFAKFGVSSDLYEIEMTGTGVNATGFEAIFGIDEIKIGTNKSIFAIFMLVVPVIIILKNYIRIDFLNKKWIDIGIPCLGVLVQIITLLDLKKLCKTFVTEEGIKLTTTLGVGFFLILLCYVLIIISKLVLSDNLKWLEKRGKWKR